MPNRGKKFPESQESSATLQQEDLVKPVRLRLNAIFNAAGSISFYAVVFLITPFVIERIGTQGWGIWQLVSSTMGILLLLSLGLGSALNNEVARNYSHGSRERLGSAINCSRAYFTLGSLLIIVIVFVGGSHLIRSLVGPVLFDTAYQTLLIAAVATAVAFVFEQFTSVVAGLQRYDLLGAFRLIQAGIFLLVVIILLRSNMQVQGFAAVMSLAPAVCGLLSWIYYRRIFPKKIRALRHINVMHFKEMLWFGLNTLSYTIGLALLYQSMKFIASWRYGGVESAGYIGLVISLIMMLNVIFLPLITVLLPRISSLMEAGNTQAISKLFFRAFSVTGLVAIPSITFLFIDADIILNAWVGSVLSETVISELTKTLRIMLIGQGLYIVSLPCFFAMAGIREHRALGLGMVFAGIFSIAASWLAGGSGAKLFVLGTVVSSCLGVLCLGLAIPVAIKRFSINIRTAIIDVGWLPLLITLPGLLILLLLPRQESYMWTLGLDMVIFSIVVAPGFFYIFRSKIQQGTLTNL